MVINESIGRPWWPQDQLPKTVYDRLVCLHCGAEWPGLDEFETSWNAGGRPMVRR
jgi:hypothetical protein